MLSELLVGEAISQEPRQPDVSAAQQVLKRRRLLGKQAASSPIGNQRYDEPKDDWTGLFQYLQGRVPRVGGVFFQEGEVIDRVQALIPQFVVKHVVLCRGTNRVRPPKSDWEAVDIPLRKTVLVKREGGAIYEDGEVEEWTRIPRYKQNRNIVPAKISLTAYGAAAKPSRMPVDNAVLENLPPEGEAKRGDDVPENQHSGDGPDIEKGYPTRTIPRHGPGFLRLGEAERKELVRLHNNLGHPAPEVFAKFLSERQAEPQMISAARDFSCSACLETSQQPKLARPSAVHLDGDFGDTLGMDVAYWTNSTGSKFLFTHIIDEATLYHQAIAIGRTPEEQFSALMDTWFRWAGPCQTLYIDPAGEYTSEFWKDMLQREGVRAHVSAGEAHWQLGRVESHGRIIKGMLSRIDSQDPIQTDAEFRLCLRQVLHAKNSLSRVKGFTPEQAVFGKMSRLPGSIVSDEEATSHTLADSELPEGVMFRRSLQRREQARTAFVQTDNDNSFRRALLRRSRPPAQIFEAGDWVLYWRRQKGCSRSERGRWYGPGQVICSDPKVVWISHCGYLIRAAPEQIRSASMREWKTLREGRSNGHPGMNHPPQTRRVVDLTGSGDVPTRGDVDEQGDPVATVPVPGETLPPTIDEEMTKILPLPSEAGEPAEIPNQPEMEVSPVPSQDIPEDVEMPLADEVEPSEVPLPSDNEDDLLFGDEESYFAVPEKGEAWEILLHETDVPKESLPSPEQAFRFVMIATTERKKRVEIKMRDLTPVEREQFLGAKSKEVTAWLDHKTVRKVAAGTLDDSQLMRCRWVLTWKAPEKEGGPKRAKARLVVLEFEDPDLSSIPNDAPTLGKDARQAILQKVASNHWKLINFDVSTAFLQGKGDGRKIGIRPPSEISDALRMKPGEQCSGLMPLFFGSRLLRKPWRTSVLFNVPSTPAPSAYLPLIVMGNPKSTGFLESM